MIAPRIVQAAHHYLATTFFDWLDPARSVAARDVPGGTGPTALSAQLRSAREALLPAKDAARGNEVGVRAKSRKRQ